MANIKIQNFAGQSWQTTIEQRAYLMLSSLSASVTNITIQFVELPADGAMPKRYRCSASSPDLTNGNCQVSVEHPNGNSAIDGSLLRFKRIVAHSRQIGRINHFSSAQNRRY